MTPYRTNFNAKKKARYYCRCPEPDPHDTGERLYRCKKCRGFVKLDRFEVKEDE